MRLWFKVWISNGTNWNLFARYKLAITFQVIFIGKNFNSMMSPIGEKNDWLTVLWTVEFTSIAAAGLFTNNPLFCFELRDSLHEQSWVRTFFNDTDIMCAFWHKT